MNILGHHGLEGRGGGTTRFPNVTNSLVAPMNPGKYDIWIKTAEPLGKVTYDDAAPASAVKNDVWVNFMNLEKVFKGDIKIGNKTLKNTKQMAYQPVKLLQSQHFDIHGKYGSVKRGNGSHFDLTEAYYWSGIAWVQISWTGLNLLLGVWTGPPAAGASSVGMQIKTFNPAWEQQSGYTTARIDEMFGDMAYNPIRNQMVMIAYNSDDYSIWMYDETGTRLFYKTYAYTPPEAGGNPYRPGRLALSNEHMFMAYETEQGRTGIWRKAYGTTAAAITDQGSGVIDAPIHGLYYSERTNHVYVHTAEKLRTLNNGKWSWSYEIPLNGGRYGCVDKDGFFYGTSGTPPGGTPVGNVLTKYQLSDSPIVWTKTVSDMAELGEVAVDGLGNIYSIQKAAAGSSSTDTRVYLRKYNSSGTLMWTQEINNTYTGAQIMTVTNWRLVVSPEGVCYIRVLRDLHRFSTDGAYIGKHGEFIPTGIPATDLRIIHKAGTACAFPNYW